MTYSATESNIPINVEIAMYGIDKDEADARFARLIELFEQKDPDSEAAGSVIRSASSVYLVDLHVTGFYGFPPIEEVVVDFKTETEAIREDIAVDYALEVAGPAE